MIRRAAVGVIVLAVALSGVGPGRTHADSSVGGAFRTPGYGARAWAMGGAVVASLDDEGTIFWNPSMLSFVHDQVLGASYVNLVPGATARQSQLAWARAYGRRDNGEGRYVARHAGGLMLTNVHFGINGGASYSENTVRAAYAFSPDFFVSIGVAGNLYFSTSDVDDFDALGTGVEGSVRMTLTDRLTLAVVARDAFSRYSFSDGADFEIPRGWQLGLAWRNPRLATIEGDVERRFSSVSRVMLGVESRYLFDHLALRGGVARIRPGESRTVLYAGIGLRALDDRLTLHYNANLDGADALSDAHRFTLSIAP